MSRCEDFPCCGHVDPDGSSYCPDEDGRFRCCDCGAKLPLNALSSLCNQCLRKINERFDDPGPQDPDDY